MARVAAALRRARCDGGSHNLPEDPQWGVHLVKRPLQKEAGPSWWTALTVRRFGSRPRGAQGPRATWDGVSEPEIDSAGGPGWSHLTRPNASGSPSASNTGKGSRPLQVSVAMANYNYGRYLREAIDSALDQTIAPLEVVVVDDGSTDESRDVLASYGDRIVTVLTNNRGQTTAINTAFDHCSGDVICLLDADDLMLPRRVEYLIEAYTAHPECEWVFHGLNFVHRDTREAMVTPSRPDFTPGFHDERPFVRRGWVSMNAPATSALSWRTSSLKGLLPVPARVRIPDNYLKFASLATAPGWVIGDALCLQGIHESNMYTTMKDGDRRSFSLHNGVAMAPGFEGLGLRMLAERFVADALVNARGGSTLDSEHREILSAWLSGLSAIRRLRLAGFCAAVGADAVIERVRARIATLR